MLEEVVYSFLRFPPPEMNFTGSILSSGGSKDFGNAVPLDMADVRLGLSTFKIVYHLVPHRFQNRKAIFT
jgi:hypothetical protein